MVVWFVKYNMSIQMIWLVVCLRTSVNDFLLSKSHIMHVTMKREREG